MTTAVRDAKYFVEAKARSGGRPFFPNVAGPINFSFEDCDRAAKSLARKGHLRKLPNGEYQVVVDSEVSV